MLRTVIALALALVAGCAAAPPPAPAPVPTTTAEASPDYGPVRASPAEQARMEAYLEGRIDRRYVRRTFKQGTDDIDCVDFDQQPSCRDHGCPHVAPPTPPGPPAGPALTTPPPPVATGNVPMCPNGTIPIVRLRIENLRRFPTLEAFFRK